MSRTLALLAAGLSAAAAFTAHVEVASASPFTEAAKAGATSSAVPPRNGVTTRVGRITNVRANASGLGPSR
jgi:hypothetical protein